MIYKVLALVVEQFWHVYCYKKILGPQTWNFTLFCYRFVQATACKKL